MQTNLLGSQKSKIYCHLQSKKRFILNTSIWPGQKDTLFDVWNCSLKRFWSAIRDNYCVCRTHVHKSNLFYILGMVFSLSNYCLKTNNFQTLDNNIQSIKHINKTWSCHCSVSDWVNHLALKFKIKKYFSFVFH